MSFYFIFLSFFSSLVATEWCKAENWQRRQQRKRIHRRTDTALECTMENDRIVHLNSRFDEGKTITSEVTDNVMKWWETNDARRWLDKSGRKLQNGKRIVRNSQRVVCECEQRNRTQHADSMIDMSVLPHTSLVCTRNMLFSLIRSLSEPDRNEMNERVSVLVRTNGRNTRD